MERIRREALLSKVCSAKEAAQKIKSHMTVATSGFTPSGYPKAVPLALSELVQGQGDFKITLITGASVGDELDGALTRCGAIEKRFAYQTNADLRQNINEGRVQYADMHLSHLPQYIQYGFLGKIDVAIVEAVAITKEGYIVPSTSVGVSPTILACADQIIVELNTAQPLALEGIHDIYLPQNPPHRKPIPIENPKDRIGTSYIPCDPGKISAIVMTDLPDTVKDFKDVGEDAEKIGAFIIDFLLHEIKMGRLPKQMLPLQSGVGNVANAVLEQLGQAPFEQLTCYTEVIQDGMLSLIQRGKIAFASGTSLTLSPKAREDFLAHIDFYKQHCILRPMEISNHPEVIRRLGVIAMNTALEMDIYGHVNSTQVLGSRMMNGIGGSGDFTRNAYLSIFSAPSIKASGNISAIVPMVSHVDHTEHDVDIMVTEQGLADLRGLSPRERAKAIISHCAHEDYRPLLLDYVKRAETKSGGHEPQLMQEALSFHARFAEKKSMKI